MLGNYFKLIFFSTMPSLISFVKSEVWPSWACYDLHHHCPDPLFLPQAPHFHSYFYFLYKNLSFHSLSSQVNYWRLLQRLLERASGPTFFKGERVVSDSAQTHHNSSMLNWALVTFPDCAQYWLYTVGGWYSKIILVMKWLHLSYSGKYRSYF